MSNIFSSSIGKKLLMSLAGLFLIVFLLVHLGINLSLIFLDTREVYNKAAHFMSSSIIIKVFEVLLFGGFLLHMIYGVYLPDAVLEKIYYKNAQKILDMVKISNTGV